MFKSLIRNSGLFLISLSVLLTGCGKKSQEQQRPPQSVVVAPALKKEITTIREVIGQTKAYDNVELVARVQGFLTNRLFVEGQTVKKGDVLFEIEKDEYQADLQTAQASLLKAQAQFDNAQIEYNRNKGLLEKNAVSKRDFDIANAKFLESKAAVMSAEASVKKAQISLNYTTIEAPFDGKIGVAYISVGNLVGGSTDTKLATVVSVDPMRVQFNIGELDMLTFAQKGATFEEAKKHVKVRLQFQDGSMYDQVGSLYFSDNRVNPSTGTIMLEALFTNKRGDLIPGFYVKVIMEADFTEPGIVIPQSAIMEGQAGTSVYVVDKDGTVQLKMVQKGTVQAPFVEIKSGLNEGDLVVTEGLQNLGSGVQVNYTYDMAYAADSTRADPLKPKSDSERAVK